MYVTDFTPNPPKKHEKTKLSKQHLRCIHGDDKSTDALVSLVLVSSSKYDCRLGFPAIGDPRLGSIEDEVVTVYAGSS